jgi:hypothetical protein
MNADATGGGRSAFASQISAVLGGRYNPKVFPAIIQAVMVKMIDVLGWTARARNDAMHQYVLSAHPSVGVDRRAVFPGKSCVPFVLREFVIFVVNNRTQPCSAERQLQHGDASWADHNYRRFQSA